MVFILKDNVNERLLKFVCDSGNLVVVKSFRRVGLEKCIVRR